MFVKINAPEGATRKEHAAYGHLCPIDDREIIVNVGASLTTQVFSQEIIFDQAKIKFKTPEHTAAAADVLRAAMAQGKTYVEINAGVDVVVLL